MAPKRVGCWGDRMMNLDIHGGLVSPSVEISHSNSRLPEEYGQDLGHLRHHWNSVVAQGSHMSNWSNGYLEGTATKWTGQGTMPTTLRKIHNQPPLSDHSNRSVSVLGPSQPPLSYHSNRSVSALALSQPPFSNWCNHSGSVLGLSQSVENMHLTPSRSFSGVSLATTEASGGGYEKQKEGYWR
ncbi:hypothetical protein O181_004624 [Austropuccinia psidii MF-1]|uniref:Uncharacterized protein n=1 Tax=Austropuccinia psidii MF-1 TaxID=1389203 RepID=A0A9Q3BG56_9BASI|nr:hypothetical protein [Austropuccinia psidii MF-1]